MRMQCFLGYCYKLITGQGYSAVFFPWSLHTSWTCSQLPCSPMPDRYVERYGPVTDVNRQTIAKPLSRPLKRRNSTEDDGQKKKGQFITQRFSWSPKKYNAVKLSWNTSFSLYSETLVPARSRVRKQALLPGDPVESWSDTQPPRCCSRFCCWTRKTEHNASVYAAPCVVFCQSQAGFGAI